MDPHSFFADQDPGVLLNAEPDPAALVLRIGIQLYKLCKKLPYEEFSVVEKQNKKDCLKVKEKNMKLVKVYLKF